jgi:hypothetical protein
MTTSLSTLEREVEAARAKLNHDLMILRSPETFSEFTDSLKAEALEAKDAIVENVKTTAKSTLADVVEDLKEKVVDNPVAALLIGGGIGWRLVARPPVATVLVAAGLLSLFKGPRLDANTARAAFNDVKDFAADVAGVVSETVSEKSREWSNVASEAARNAGAEIANVQPLAAAPEMMRTAQRAGADAISKSREAVAQASASMREAMNDVAVRDRMLLGLAGLAVAAAAGMSARRRQADVS